MKNVPNLRKKEKNQEVKKYLLPKIFLPFTRVVGIERSKNFSGRASRGFLSLLQTQIVFLAGLR
jgi:hypothetical protein